VRAPAALRANTQRGQRPARRPARGAPRREARRLTGGRGARRGTPGYMAPEMSNAPCVATRAADVFSLGVMLAELLTDGAMLAAGSQARPRPPCLSLFIPP